ncbi:S1-like domain-containing RNA-binding protein [Aerococcaceae bacterium NML190938]|nr:S1-like domain-containing RNA-binding protein [Aerococcaceae bacterium NML190938]
MAKYGTIVTATVTDENEKEYFVQVDGVTFALNKEDVDETLVRGNQVEGMIYETRNGKKVIQTELPDIRPEYYGWGTVVQARKDLGVFVDIGLKDKEVVVSLDDLPALSHLWPKKEGRLFLTYTVDERNRFWGKMADEEVMRQQFKKAPTDAMNQNVTATVYRVKKAGSLCITTEGYSAFLHESERQTEPRLGEVLEARVIGVRQDGGINISLKPRAHEAIDDDAGLIQAILMKAPGHFLPLHDKSDPEQIIQQLGISKGQFKRAVGQLLKKKLIRQVKGEGIYLNDEATSAGV